jgi:hypothetical protein
MSVKNSEKELSEIRIDAVKSQLRAQYFNQTTIQAEVQYLNYHLTILDKSEKDKKLRVEYESDINSDKEKLIDIAKKISILEDLYRKLLDGNKKTTTVKL